ATLHLDRRVHLWRQYSFRSLRRMLYRGSARGGDDRCRRKVRAACKRLRHLLAAQRPVIFSSCSGYRAPCTVIFEAALSISRRSSAVSSIAAAPMFSSRRWSFVVPGLGTFHGFCP